MWKQKQILDTLQQNYCNTILDKEKVNKASEGFAWDDQISSLEIVNSGKNPGVITPGQWLFH